MNRPDRKVQPWEKELVELTKFDWLLAVGMSHWHKHSPLQLRVAIVLMQHADGKTMLAWPSQRTIAQYAGVAAESQVRRAVAALCESQALKRCRISQLDEADQAKVTRNKRGVAYRLSMFWALEILEASQAPLPRMPKQLRDGLAAKAAKAKAAPDEFDRSTLERNDRSTLERHTPLYDRAPYQKGILRDQRKDSPSDENLASTREASAYALASGRAG